MPPALTKDDVERVAALAHLELTDEEKQLFARQLADILEHARDVAALDTTGVPPTLHVLTRHPAERDDQSTPGLTTGEALANAPDPAPASGLFRVPRIL